jgi:hypothetical protein
MRVAKEIGRKRYVMFNEKSDSNNEMFDLNKDILRDSNNGTKKAKPISPGLIDEMLTAENPFGAEQLELSLSG